MISIILRSAFACTQWCCCPRHAFAVTATVTAATAAAVAATTGGPAPRIKSLFTTTTLFAE